jgi:hypothetical protein
MTDDEDDIEEAPLSLQERRIRDEYRRAHREASQDIELVEPTEDERKNGWTAESLTAYLQDQKAAQSLRTDPHSAMRQQPPMRANSKYRPLRWRG